MQTDSIAVLPGSSTSRISLKPNATFLARTRSFPASGSTTTRRTAGSAKQKSITAPKTAVVKPGRGSPVGGATSTCMPTSPGRTSGSPANGECATSYRSTRKAGSPSTRPRNASWCGFEAICWYSAATSATLAPCIIQKTDRGWVTQPCSRPRSRSTSSGSMVILIARPPAAG